MAGSTSGDADAPSPRVVGMAGGVALGLIAAVVTAQWWWVVSLTVVGGVVGTVVGRYRSD